MASLESSPGAEVARGTLARPVWLWAILLTVLFSLPSLLVGLVNDDLTHRLMLTGRVPGYTGGWFGLYDFTSPSWPTSALIKQGQFPWFTDPSLSLRLLRPLSSATLAIDHVWFGRNSLLAHLHSLLWMALLVGTVGRLYQRWFSAPAALLSAVVFALSGVHGIPLSWIASRHTVVAASLGALSLWAWVRFREDHHKAGLAWSVLALVASLLSSESGLCTVVLLVGYELGSRGWRRGSSGALLPMGIGVAYLVLYAGLGYGARGSEFYISPFDSPLRYAIAAFWGIPTLSAELLLGVPTLFVSIGGHSVQVLLTMVGFCALVGTVLLLRAVNALLPAGAARMLAFLLAASLLSLLALVGAPASGRVLPLPMFGIAAVAGHLLWGTWSMARHHSSAASPSRASNRLQRDPGTRNRWWVAFGVVALFQLVLSPLMRLAMPFGFKKSSEQLEQLALNADVGACAKGGSLYIVNGSDPVLTLYGGASLLFYAPEKAGAERLRVLSMAPQAQRLSRTSPHVLALDVLDTPRQSNPFEHLFRPGDKPLRAGHNVDLGELQVHVDAAESGLFTRAHFAFTRDLDQTHSCLVVWKKGRLQRLPMLRIGETVRIEHEPGPMGL